MMMMMMAMVGFIFSKSGSGIEREPLVMPAAYRHNCIHGKAPGRMRVVSIVLVLFRVMSCVACRSSISGWF